MDGCIKLPLGTEVGLGPDDIMLDEAQQKRGTAPQWSPISVAGELLFCIVIRVTTFLENVQISANLTAV